MRNLTKAIVKFWKDEPYLAVVILASFFYGLFFSLISVLRYNAFSFSDYDSAIYIHEAWKILHGSTENSILQHVSIWGNAVEAISFVTAPLFALCGQRPECFFVLQSFALGFGAVPVFLTARRKLPTSFALSLAFSYLFYPALWYMNLYEYNPLSLATFTLLMAFYYFDAGRFRLLMLFIILSMINRLDVGIVTVMFGVYALVCRRPWKWVLAPSLVSLAWLCLGLFVLIPTFKKSFGFYDLYYPQFGQGFVNIVVNIITHPQILFQSLFTKLNGIFMFEVLFPVFFLPLFGVRELLICVLSVLQHLLSVRTNEHTIMFHYTATMIPFVYVSAVYGMARCLKELPKLRLWILLLPLIASLAGNAFYGPMAKPNGYIRGLFQDDMDRYKKEMIRKIPQQAVVTSSFPFSSMLAGRQEYYSFHYIYAGLYHTDAPYPTPQNVDFALIDFAETRLLNFHTNSSEANVRKFIELNHLGVADMAGSTVLFERDRRGGMKLYNIKPDDGSSSWLLETGGIRLKSFNTGISRSSGFRFLDLAFHWTITGPAPDAFGMVLMLFDSKDNLVHVDNRLLGYGVLSPDKWETGREVTEYYRMLLPQALEAGPYSVVIEFFIPGSGDLAVIQTPDASTSTKFELMKVHVPELGAIKP